jgi:hypothetical protein
MRLLRLVLALPLIAAGAYLALVSLLVGCANLAAGPPARTGFLLLTGLPTSVGEWVVGALGMVLIGLGWALATGGRGR